MKVLRGVVCFQALYKMHRERTAYLKILEEKARERVLKLQAEKEARQRAEKERKLQEELQKEKERIEEERKRRQDVFRLEIPADLSFMLHCVEGVSTCRDTPVCEVHRHIISHPLNTLH